MIRKFRVSLYEYFQSSTFTERLPKVVSVKHRPTYLEEYRSTCCVTAARNQLNPRAGCESCCRLSAVTNSSKPNSIANEWNREPVGTGHEGRQRNGCQGNFLLMMPLPVVPLTFLAP
jgi:hypothetical protein